MGFLVNSDAIILDLRQNGGGNPDGVQLICSYFFGVKPVHLNDLFSRPENKTEEFWTLEKVDGKRMPDVDLYVLTSKYTFSGGEEFAYNLKNLKRATIVGDVTGGGAHPGVTMRLNDNFIIFVPNGRAINPVTKTNWEGIGVQPDVKVQQEKALETAHVLALEKIAKRKKESSAKKEIEWLIETLKSSLNPVRVEENALQRYAGSYSDRLVTFENGKLYYQRKDRQKYELIPMSEDLFRLKDLEVFRIKFEKDKSGIVTGLTGMYSDGRSDRSLRSN
jgi:C-terminal processing protease CtpA/Prc